MHNWLINFAVEETWNNSIKIARKDVHNCNFSKAITLASNIPSRTIDFYFTSSLLLWFIHLKGINARFEYIEDIFFLLLLIYTCSLARGIPMLNRFNPRTLPGIPLSTWLCTLSTSPSPLDAILIPNSKKITLPSELLKGVLDEIASVTCQPAWHIVYYAAGCSN